MAVRKPRYSKEEFAKRGEAIFDKDIRPRLKNEAARDFVAIDIETGAYEIDANQMAACARLDARVPDAQVWIRRVGSPFVHSFGGHKNHRSIKNMPRKQRKLLGRYIVADPEICHGKPTFLGTRIMVAQVLKQVAKGMPWDAIAAEWRGAVAKDAITEAVELAQRIFEDHAAEYTQESLPA